jgi:hypothetical protein
VQVTFTSCNNVKKHKNSAVKEAPRHKTWKGIVILVLYDTAGYIGKKNHTGFCSIHGFMVSRIHRGVLGTEPMEYIYGIKGGLQKCLFLFLRQDLGI